MPEGMRFIGGDRGAEELPPPPRSMHQRGVGPRRQQRHLRDSRGEHKVDLVEIAGDPEREMEMVNYVYLVDNSRAPIREHVLNGTTIHGGKRKAREYCDLAGPCTQEEPPKDHCRRCQEAGRKSKTLKSMEQYQGSLVCVSMFSWHSDEDRIARALGQAAAAAVHAPIEGFPPATTIDAVQAARAAIDDVRGQRQVASNAGQVVALPRGRSR